jgi:hypothetical protein
LVGVGYSRDCGGWAADSAQTTYSAEPSVPSSATDCILRYIISINQYIAQSAAVNLLNLTEGMFDTIEWHH